MWRTIENAEHGEARALSTSVRRPRACGDEATVSGRSHGRSKEARKHNGTLRAPSSRRSRPEEVEGVVEVKMSSGRLPLIGGSSREAALGVGGARISPYDSSMPTITRIWSLP